MAGTAVTEEQIREIARKIGEQPGVVQVWLFGSHATGTAGPDSDVDLLAVYEDEPDPMEAVQRLRRLLFEHAVPVDVLAIGREKFERTRGIPGRLANFVVHEGRVVHGRTFARS
ncbi:MAG: nucleotidyltransferase domain-containing protein [Armatimonadota bacterium]